MNFEENRAILERYEISITEEKFIKNRQTKVIVGMSGGVDSSVVAQVLKLQGYQVQGIFMRNWEEDDPETACPAKEDFKDVSKVADKIGILYQGVDFVKEYRDQVFSHFVEEYKKGRTPNPDILCNREIKFQVFYDYAKKLGADLLATGHYCQTVQREGHTYLAKGRDENKDQSYFLYAIDQKVLPEVLFPIGHLEKKWLDRLLKILILPPKIKKIARGSVLLEKEILKNFSLVILKSKEVLLSISIRVKSSKNMKDSVFII